MKTFEDIEQFRRQTDALQFAENWVAEIKNIKGPCDHLLNLTIWSESNPHEALGIILHLIDKAGGDDSLEEAVAMGPATKIVESSHESFTPFIREAIVRYPKFALYTKWLRENSEDSCWRRLAH